MKTRSFARANRQRPIKVILVDRNHLVRCGILLLLRDIQSIQVVGEVHDCEEAILRAPEACPDVAMVHLNKYDVDLFSAIEKLTRQLKKLKVIVITDCSNEVILSSLLEMGVLGYLSMNASQEEIVNALKSTYNGERYVCSEIAHDLALAAVTKEPSIFKKLSNRELQIALLMSQGLDIKEIAEKLYLSSKTMSTYRHHILQKLGLKNEVEMALLALSEGLVALD
jgi:two-component system, NarL family, invasion response regulator UvrY